MAVTGPWGCYIHIPKTSGLWTKRVLSQLGTAQRSGQTHSFPLHWAHKRMFTIVREPADWLRSVFCNRRQSRWKEHPEQCPWSDFVEIIKPYRSDDFEEFIDSLTTKAWGVVGWLYNCYTPPRVTPIRYGEDQVKFLEELGCHPERIMATNVSGNKPEITEEIQNKIYLAEHETYGKYHWAPDGRCMYIQSFTFEEKPQWK